MGKRGGRAQDTTMVIRRVCGIVVTVYLALVLKDGDDLSCGCSGEKICRLGGSRPCLCVNVGVRHRRMAKFRVQAATRSNERMPTMLDGMIVFVALEAKPPVYSQGISAK